MDCLTTISGRTQLLARAVRRSPSIADEEQGTLLTGLAMIKAAVMTAVAVLAGVRDEASGPGPHDPAAG